MNILRLLLVLCLISLSGCLVGFREPLPARQAAPSGLLGQWSSLDAWGQPMTLELSRTAPGAYLAVSYPTGKPYARQRYPFTVSRHGNRWYLSAPLPVRFGADRYAIAGFEVTDKHELVVYNLDVEQVEQAIAQKSLQGQPIEVEEGEGVLVTSELSKVLTYLDDPANSDLFVEAARFQRPSKHP